MYIATGKWLGALWVAGILAHCLPVPTLAQDPKPAPVEKPASEIPSASPRGILDRFAALVGGDAAFAKIKSQRAKGRFEIKGQEVKGAIDILAAPPNKLVLHIDVPGLMKMSTGFDGKVGWSSNPITGPMLLTGKALDTFTTQSDFQSALHPPEKYKKIELQGRTDFHGEPCFKILLVHTNDVEMIEYFSEKSGLMTGSESTQDTPLGPMKVVSRIGEYKPFGALLMPTKISQDLFGVEQTIWIDDVAFNTVEDSVFELPPDVQALLPK